ncbi:YppG family protein [Bacillus coreaensis]
MFGQRYNRPQFQPMMNEAYPYMWGNEAVHTRPEAYANYFEQPMNVPMYNMNYSGPVQNGYNYFPNDSFYGPAYPYGGGGFQGQGFDYPYQGNQPYSQEKKHKLSEAVLHNPLQQPEISYHNQFAYGQYSQPFSHPYPKQSAIPRPPTGVKSIMNSFKTQDGTFDVNKMVDTAGQMMNAVTQVSSMVKGLGGMFKV